MRLNLGAGKMEVKRSFRLRPVDTTGRMNRRYAYLRSPCITAIAALQLLIGLQTIIVQILTFLASTSFCEDGLCGSGIGMGCIQILASGFTLMAAQDPTYSWLHFAMSANIISAIGSYLFAAYIMSYPLKSLLEIQAIYQRDNTKSRPYSGQELDALITYGYIQVIASIGSFAVGTFLGICTGRPVCCGQRHLNPGRSASCRKSSDDGPKSPHGGNTSPIKLEFRPNPNANEAGGGVTFSRQHFP